VIPRELEWLLSLAKLLLESREIERIVLPTIVDALVEREDASSVRKWRWMSQWRLACAIGAALVASFGERVRAIPWGSMLGLGLSGLCGAIVLQRQTGMGPSPIAHCIYVGLAGVVSIVVVVVPPKVAPALRYLAYGVITVALLLCPWFGHNFEGRRQWLGLGSFFFHVASIGLPAFAAFSFATLERRQYGRYLLVLGGVLVLLGLQPNLPDLCLYLAVAVVCALQLKPRWLLHLTWGSSAMGALVLGRHFLVGTLWEQLGLGAFGAVLVRMLWVFTARERHRIESVSSRWLRGMTFGCVLCVVLIVRELTGDGIPLLSAGASIMVSVFTLFAIALRSLEPARL
jgi:cell division protein FtsW (lipid II flippase)